MRAVALGSGGHLEVVEKAEPVPGPTDVVVSVERCGICGSDLHLKQSGLLPVGAVMGHEFAGLVTALGAEAPTDLEGRRVAVLPADRCGTCELCTAGKGHLCRAQLWTAIGLGLNDGAFAGCVRVPARSCRPLPDAMTPEQGALVEPYAVGLHAVNRSLVSGFAVQAEADLAAGIVGAGPIGLMCLAALRRAGVIRVVVAEPDEGRAAVAQAMGATVVEDAGRLGRALDGPLDVVFEAAGVTATPPLALGAVRPGGQVVLVGTVGPGQVLPMPGLLWVVNEVDVLASMAYTDDEFSEAVAAVASGAVDPALVVSDVRPLDAAQQSFDELGRRSGLVKVLLAPGW